MTNLSSWLPAYVGRKLRAIEKEALTPGLDPTRTEFLRGSHAALTEMLADLERSEKPVDNADEGDGVYPL